MTIFYFGVLMKDIWGAHEGYSGRSKKIWGAHAWATLALGQNDSNPC